MEIFINGKKVFELDESDDLTIRVSKGNPEKSENSSCWFSKIFGLRKANYQENVNVVSNGSIISDKSGPDVNIEIKGNAGNVNAIGGSIVIQGDANDIFASSGNITVKGNTTNIDGKSGNIVVQGNCSGNIKTISGNVIIKNERKEG